MNNIQLATAKALGCIVIMAGRWAITRGEYQCCHPGKMLPDANRVEWIDVKPGATIHFLPDPSDPRVYEEVIKLAIEKDAYEYMRELCSILPLPFTPSDLYQDLATATPEQRLRAALITLGEIE